MTNNRIIKPSVFLSVLFLCGAFQAGLAGERDLASGPTYCPAGSLQTLINKTNPNLFRCSPVKRGLEGDYELISGTSKCPAGSLQTLVDKTEPEQMIFLFGARHSWPLDMKDVSESKEVVEGGCTYVWTYQKSEKSFVMKTTRSRCPTKDENGVATEKMILQDDKLTYEFAFKKTNFKCRYKKVIEP